MAARITYGGHSLRDLKQWARELSIPGRSRMAGSELLAACKAETRRHRRNQEAAVLAAGPVAPGVRLVQGCGCVIRVTSPVQALRSLGDEPADTPLFVHGSYEVLCPRCFRDHPAGIEHVNLVQEVGPHRFFLWSMGHEAQARRGYEVTYQAWTGDQWETHRLPPQSLRAAREAARGIRNRERTGFERNVMIHRV